MYFPRFFGFHSYSVSYLRRFTWCRWVGLTDISTEGGSQRALRGSLRPNLISEEGGSQRVLRGSLLPLYESFVGKLRLMKHK